MRLGFRRSSFKYERIARNRFRFPFYRRWCSRVCHGVSSDRLRFTRGLKDISAPPYSRYSQRGSLRKGFRRANHEKDPLIFTTSNLSNEITKPLKFPPISNFAERFLHLCGDIREDRRGRIVYPDRILRLRAVKFLLFVEKTAIYNRKIRDRSETSESIPLGFASGLIANGRRSRNKNGLSIDFRS